jgi:hypothetical protein
MWDVEERILEGTIFLYMNHVYKGGGIGEERALVIFFTAFRNFNT